MKKIALAILLSHNVSCDQSFSSTHNLSMYRLTALIRVRPPAWLFISNYVSCIYLSRVNRIAFSRDLDHLDPKLRKFSGEYYISPPRPHTQISITTSSPQRIIVSIQCVMGIERQLSCKSLIKSLIDLWAFHCTNKNAMAKKTSPE